MKARSDSDSDITRLLKRGLNHYGLGELEAAIACWERARALDRGNRAARDYLETAYEERAEADQTKTATSVTLGVDSGEQDNDADTPHSWAFANYPELPLPDHDPDTRITSALKAYKAGDPERAWALLREVEREMPDRIDVQGYIVLARGECAKKFAREIGDKGRALRLTCKLEELKALNLRPEEGFLLSQVDGNVTIEELISLSSMDRVTTLESLARFLREGLVE